MINRISFRLILATGLLACSANLWANQEEEEMAIRKAAAAYVEAFNAQDTATLASMWAMDAEYENIMTGDKVVGRAEIEKQLRQIFAEQPGLKLEVETTKVRFLAPQVALEEGIARVLLPNEAPDETTYTTVHIKVDGRWLIARMSEQPKLQLPSNYGQLQGLEWMTGTWVDQDDEATVETTCQWTRNQNFLLRSFKVVIGDDIDLSGIQLIGWDAAHNEIRSWAFDSDGGFAIGEWEKRGNDWVVKSTATLPDGRQSTAVNTMTMIDDTTYSWKSTGREVDGEIQPNMAPVIIKRKNTMEPTDENN